MANGKGDKLKNFALTPLASYLPKATELAELLLCGARAVQVCTDHHHWVGATRNSRGDIKILLAHCVYTIYFFMEAILVSFGISQFSVRRILLYKNSASCQAFNTPCSQLVDEPANLSSPEPSTLSPAVTCTDCLPGHFGPLCEGLCPGALSGGGACRGQFC